MKKVRFLWYLLAIAFLPGLLAVEPQPRVFRVVSLGGDLTEFLYDNGRQTGLRIVAYPGSFSKEYAAPSGGTLTLYRVVQPSANAPAGTRPTKEILAEIAYPQDAGRTILLLQPGASNAPHPLSGHVVADPVDRHKTGMARVFNLSSLPIAFAAPDRVAQAQPRSLQAMAPFTPGSCHVKVAAQVGGAWQPVMDIQRNLSANLRLFVLLTDAPSIEGGPPVACAMLHDFVRPPMTFVKQDKPSS